MALTNRSLWEAIDPALSLQNQLHLGHVYLGDLVPSGPVPRLTGFLVPPQDPLGVRPTT